MREMRIHPNHVPTWTISLPIPFRNQYTSSVFLRYNNSVNQAIPMQGRASPLLGLGFREVAGVDFYNGKIKDHYVQYSSDKMVLYVFKINRSEDTINSSTHNRRIFRL